MIVVIRRNTHNVAMRALRSRTRRCVTRAVLQSGSSPSCQNKSYLHLASGAFQVPMPGKPNPLGEDAFLQLPSSTIHRGGAAVFDGVGGWYYSGVDPRVYATGLSEEVAKGIEEAGSIGGEELVNVLHEASTSMDRRGIVGGTTACVCVLDAGGDSADHGVLHIANIGDSAAMVFRDGKPVFSTPPSMNDATCPKQLGTRANRAACADTFAFDVIRGDVLVCATDGLLDNINKTRIGQLVHSKRSLIIYYHVSSGVESQPLWPQARCTLGDRGGDRFGSLQYGNQRGIPSLSCIRIPTHMMHCLIPPGLRQKQFRWNIECSHQNTPSRWKA